tara:strand:- start:2178 stop:7187 length:5010 start_codon:yes stop_codon:yes gene_type:complete
MKRPTSRPSNETSGSFNPDNFKTNKQKCVERFLHWWPNSEELRKIIINVLTRGAATSTNPEDLLEIIEENGKISNSQKLAELLYDIIGPNFLLQIYGEKINGPATKRLRELILKACVENDPPDFSDNEIIQAAIEKKYDYHWENMTTVEEVAEMPVVSNRGWRIELVKWLELPIETISAPPTPDSPEASETIIPNREYKPLHDYQIATSLEIRNRLQFEDIKKRLLISIPTGAGKTRIAVESIVDWLNKGKQCSPLQQKNSKYILWIAQSRELCEQAISEFKQIYQQKGESAITIHRLFADNHNLSNVLACNDEQAIIVATINKLYETANTASHFSDLEEQANDKKEDQTSNDFYNHPIFQQFRDLTACIIIDEAHRATTKMYTRVLHGMGFNYRKNEPEINEKGIVLVGITATPFRGKGTEDYDSNELNPDTKRLYLRFDKPYYPEINDISDNKKPVAIIDSPSKVFTETTVRLSSVRSFDNNSVIVKWKWEINKEQSLVDELLPSEKKNSTPLPDPSPQKEIDYKFSEPGTYKIILTITNKDDNSTTIDQIITVEPKQNIVVKDGLEKQKVLIQSLVNRQILCDVYHGKIEGGKVRIFNEKEAEKNRQEITKETKAELAIDRNRNNRILSAIDYYLHDCDRKKILVFACNIEHARNLSLILNAKYNIKADFVDSQVSPKQRVEKINQFKKGEIDVLCNVDILTTGFDVPDVDCVLIARPAKSTVLYTQMIGRGMRGKKMGGTDDVWLVDMDDQVQLATGFKENVISLGWKNMSELWGKISDCKSKDGQPIKINFAGLAQGSEQIQELEEPEIQSEPAEIQSEPVQIEPISSDSGPQSSFLISGPWSNWGHSLENRIDDNEIMWATRGADPSDIGVYEKLKIGDFVFFANAMKDPGPFSKKVVFGFGKATAKFIGKEPFWPDELRTNNVIYKYRFTVKPVHVTLMQSDAIPWIQGLPFTKGFNSIVNREIKSELLNEVMKKWLSQKQITRKTSKKTETNDLPLNHTCQNCGLFANGINEVIDKFGYAPEDKTMIIDLFKFGKLKEQLTPLCIDCSKEKSSSTTSLDTKLDWVRHLNLTLKTSGIDWQVIQKEPEYFILKNNNDLDYEKRVFVSYGNKEKEKMQVDVGIKDKAMAFLREVDTKNSFVIVVNISQNAFVTLPFKTLEENGIFRGGVNWDETGQTRMWFTMSDLAYEKATLSDRFDCTDYVNSVKPIFEKVQASECPFCSYMEKQPLSAFKANYQFEFGLYLIECQKNNTIPTFEDAVKFLQKTNNDKYAISSFDAVFDVYEKRGLISVRSDDVTLYSPRGQRRLLVKKILDISRFEEILRKRYQDYKDALVSSTPGLDSQKRKLDEEWADLSMVFDHIPTTREFGESVDTRVYTTMKELYGHYSNFLKSKGLDLTKDLALRDLLYEEYFELYFTVQRKISPTEIHEYKKWKIEDYNEVFGSYEKLLEIVEPITSRLENIDESQEGPKGEQLIEEFNQMTRQLDHSPHFDEMLHDSKIGIEYIINEYGTFGRFKKVAQMGTETNFVIVQLTSDYYKIKSELDIQPTHKHMIDYSDYGSRLDDLFSTYPEFLEHIGARINNEYASESALQKRHFEYEKWVYQEKQNQMREKFLQMQNDTGLVPTIKSIHDDSPIKYDEWFGDKETFIEKTFGQNGLNIYDKL